MFVCRVTARVEGTKVPEFRTLRLSELNEPPLPIRSLIEEGPLAALAEDVRVAGVVVPLIVVPDGPMYEIVDGHRRYLAAARVGVETVPAIVFPSLVQAKEAVMLRANMYREEPTAADEALFLAELIQKFDYTEADLCRMVGQSLAWVNQRLDLLRYDKEVFAAIRERKLSFAAGRELNRIPDERRRRYLLQQAIESDATARVVRQWVEQWKLEQVGPPGPAAEAVPPESQTPATDNGLRCFLCGGDKDPFNLEVIYVHKWEKAHLEMILRGGTLETRRA